MLWTFAILIAHKLIDCLKDWSTKDCLEKRARVGGLSIHAESISTHASTHACVEACVEVIKQLIDR